MKPQRVDPRDLVLAIVAFNREQKVEGRTLLQKLAYFLNEALELGIQFEPYYYGPYSESIAMATNSLVGLDFLNEVEARFPAMPTDMFEPRKYTYRLTSSGLKILSNLQKQQPDLFAHIKRAMESITSKEECNYECLSLAAKIFHILKSQQRPMKGSELQNAAIDLGWNLSKGEIDSAANFLKELGLIKDAS